MKRTSYCNEKSNLSNNYVESDKEKEKCRNVNVKSLSEQNLNHPIFVQINYKLYAVCVRSAGQY